MICSKCGHGMIQDLFEREQVFKCWVCGNREYVGCSKRIGTDACVKCGDPVETNDGPQYCSACLKFIHIGDTCADRTYGEALCRCGTIFIRKSPTQTYHSRNCRNQFAYGIKPVVKNKAKHAML